MEEPPPPVLPLCYGKALAPALFCSPHWVLVSNFKLWPPFKLPLVLPGAHPLGSRADFWRMVTPSFSAPLFLRNRVSQK